MFPNCEIKYLHSLYFPNHCEKAFSFSPLSFQEHISILFFVYDRKCYYQNEMQYLLFEIFLF